MDSAAFVALVRAHDPRLRRLAHRLLARDERVDDVLQEAYVRAFRSLPALREDAHVGTWLYRITYNCCIDELRSSARRPRPVATVDEAVAPGAEPGLRVALGTVVRDALAALPDDQRVAVVLVDGEGFDYNDAAEILGVPRGTVASRVARARQTLRTTLAGERELLA